LAFVLEEKVTLGLAAPPPERVPLEKLSEEELVERAITERREKVDSENLTITSKPKRGIWGDYQVVNPKSGGNYRVSFRGFRSGEVFCECPDFKVNGLGLCKHTLAVEGYLSKSKRQMVPVAPWEPTEVEVYLDYTVQPAALRVQAPKSLSKSAQDIIAPYLNQPVKNATELVRAIAAIESEGEEITVFPDALERLELGLYRERLAKLTEAIKRDPGNHPLRTSLLKVELLPYQMAGIAFAAAAGRVILADDMGLGKTIQGVGLAELLAREEGLRKVLIVCPASLKSQWQDEIERFCDRSSTLILGAAKDRSGQYNGDSFFTICNYEQVNRDKRYVMSVDWDLLILDEAQRVKNWETATHRSVAEIKSRHLLLLTGTPLENSLGELFTLVRLVDPEILGPAFRFLNAHKETDDRGKLLAWRGLNEVKAALAPVFLRRTREEVMKELPPRQVEIIRVPVTEEQQGIHDHQMRMIKRIIMKPYLTEMDFLRLKKHLLMARLAANSTYLAEKILPGVSSKIDEFKELMARLALEEERKIVVFSEWTSMLDLVETELKKLSITWVRLDGSVPQTKRKALVKSFTENPAMRVFLATNAGSTGLNLQAADTVVNLDLPWNPAILDQRIGRVHRMGQTRMVQVFLLVTADTIEERLLDLLGAKSVLAQAALDLESDIDSVEMTSGIDALKNRLEILLGQKPDKPLKEAVDPGIKLAERRQRLSETGGKLLNAVFDFLGELIPAPDSDQNQSSAVNGKDPSDGNGGGGADGQATDSPVEEVKNLIMSCFDKDEEGRTRFSFVLPNEDIVNKAVNAIGRFFAGRF
jgi:superfamily II DNA or RNA helicase